jgi:hypothetical protein
MTEFRQVSPWEVPSFVRRVLTAFALPAALVLCCFSFASTAAADSVTLAPSSPGDYRWLNVADQAYAATYQSTYNYGQAAVTFAYNPSAGVFAGVLTAANLKPNFAYQLKLSGTPGTAANERIGLAGRWWEETWSGTAWTGQNLNDKGSTGSSPNPNDATYYSERDVLDATSPTGHHYKFTGYLVFDFFVTDDSGNASLVTQQDSSFHVLWKDPQSGQTYDSIKDGPEKSSTFDPNPASLAYLGTDYPATTRTIYGEWERLPDDGVFLAPGSYSARLVLTEESFHGNVSQGAGNWAAAMEGTVAFAIVPEPATITLFAAGFAALLARSRRRRSM